MKNVVSVVLCVLSWIVICLCARWAESNPKIIAKWRSKIDALQRKQS